MDTTRTEDGEPIPGTDVVLCDAVAYLSGVNYGSVVKVIAAINAVQDAAKLPASEHLLMDCVPTTSVNVREASCHTRVRNTDMFVRRLVAAGIADRYEILDKSTARFRH